MFDVEGAKILYSIHVISKADTICLLYSFFEEVRQSRKKMEKIFVLD